MDSTLIGTLVTVVFFVIFVGIFYWAWSDRRKAEFEEAANYPFAEDEPVKTAPPRQ